MRLWDLHYDAHHCDIPYRLLFGVEEVAGPDARLPVAQTPRFHLWAALSEYNSRRHDSNQSQWLENQDWLSSSAP